MVIENLHKITNMKDKHQNKLIQKNVFFSQNRLCVKFRIKIGFLMQFDTNF